MSSTSCRNNVRSFSSASTAIRRATRNDGPASGTGSSRPHTPTRWAALVSVLLAASLVASANPAQASYGLDEDSWNGVGYLLHTAREAKVELDVVSGALDLGSLRPGDVLFWLYPTTPLPVDELAKFVRDGGYLIVADDRGLADPLFERFGSQRSSAGPTHHTDYYLGQTGLPVVKPVSGVDHFLYFNVDKVVANHPAVFTGAGSPVYSFQTPPGSPPEHLVVEHVLGRGRFIAISDPSLFINDMIGRPEVHGNKQFAANVMRRNCTRECRVRLLLPHSSMAGTYRERGGPLGDLPRLFDDAANLLNESLAEASSDLAQAPWSWLVVVVLGIVALLAVPRGLGHVSSRPRHVTTGGTTSSVSPLIHDALGLSATRFDADFADLTQTLLTHVEGLASAGLVPSVDSDGAGDDATRLARRALLRIRGEAASFQGSGEPPLITSERFLRLYDDVRVIARFAAALGHHRKRPPRPGASRPKEAHVRV